MTNGEPSQWAISLARHVIEIDEKEALAFKNMAEQKIAATLDEARAQWEREVVEWLRGQSSTGAFFAEAIAKGEHRPKP